MDGTGLSLIKCFENVEDYRVDRTKLHKLIDIIVMAICALVAEDVVSTRLQVRTLNATTTPITLLFIA
jgi:hypothetical protein